MLPFFFPLPSPFFLARFKEIQSPREREGPLDYHPPARACPRRLTQPVIYCGLCCLGGEVGGRWRLPHLAGITERRAPPRDCYVRSLTGWLMGEVYRWGLLPQTACLTWVSRARALSRKGRYKRKRQRSACSQQDTQRPGCPRRWGGPPGARDGCGSLGWPWGSVWDTVHSSKG